MHCICGSISIYLDSKSGDLRSPEKKLKKREGFCGETTPLQNIQMKLSYADEGSC